MARYTPFLTFAALMSILQHKALRYFKLGPKQQHAHAVHIYIHPHTRIGP